MAGLRARLIRGAMKGGGGEQGPTSIEQALSNIGSQIAAQYAPEDSDIAQARQLQALKIQAMQGKLQAQQQEQETMAGYGRLGEQIVPEAGTEVPTEAQGPGAGQVLGTFAGAPTANDLLLRKMIQSGNPSLLAKAQAQFAPQEPGPQGTVEEIGGQKFTRDVQGNLHPIPIKEPVKKDLNQLDLEAFVASNGVLRGPSIPAEMTVEQGKATLISHRSMAQQGINIRLGEIAAKHSSQPLINRESGEVEFPSGNELVGNPGKWIKASGQDMTMYALLRNIGPQVEGMKSLLDRVLVEGPGGNLINGIGAMLKRGGGSTPELAAWDVLKSDVTVENTRALAGSSRPPVMLLKLIRGQLPTTASNISAAKTELDLIQANADNRMRGIRGMPPRPLPVPGGGNTPPPPAGFR